MRTFDFGIFLPVANNGMIASTVHQYMPTLDYDFLMSTTKWRGCGGATRHWDHAQEGFTLMSGLAAVTSRIQLVAGSSKVFS